MTQTSFRTANKTHLRSATNILSSRPSYEGWEDSEPQGYLGKPSLNDELERLRNKLNTVNRYEDVMHDMRKVGDKKFVMEMDNAIGNVKANRMPSKREMKNIFSKHLPPEKYPPMPKQQHAVSFSNMRKKPKHKRLRNYSPSTVNSSDSEEFEDEMSEARIREIAEKRAKEILDKKIAEETTLNYEPVNPYAPPPVQNNIVKLPSGMVMIKNHDPNIPPTLVMPPEKDTDVDETDNASDTEDIMNEYMDNLMQLKMMEAMQPKPKKHKKNMDDALDNLKDEMESKKTRKKKKKKRKRPKAPRSIPLDMNPNVSLATTHHTGKLLTILDVCLTNFRARKRAKCGNRGSRTRT
jgi:hypothetical protein